jgi:hypothetical protein
MKTLFKQIAQEDITSEVKELLIQKGYYLQRCEDYDSWNGDHHYWAVYKFTAPPVGSTEPNAEEIDGWIIAFEHYKANN